MQPSLGFEKLARTAVTSGHQSLNPPGFVLWLGEAQGLPGVIGDGQDRIVSDLKSSALRGVRRPA